MPTQEARERFAELVARELGALRVRVLDRLEPLTDVPRTLRVELSQNRCVEAVFEVAPRKRADLTRKLLLLVRAFELAIFSPKAPQGDGPAVALAEELGALAGRAGAGDALVIDARSPVIWGSARGVVGTHEPAEVVRIGKPRRPAEPPSAKRRAERAIARVRALPALVTLARGGHLAYLEQGRQGGFLARSFAGIYVIVVVFDAAIDELRAERALCEHVPAIERLIVAMPPREPAGGAKVVSLRAKRARRA